MYKNQANQNITFLMLSLVDNSPVTGLTPTVSITKDNGSQAAATGTVSEKGNGVYNYAPTQSETNANCISFLFQGTGARSINENVYPEDTSIVRAANVTHLNGGETSAPNAVLHLKGINVISDSGAPIFAMCTSGNEPGFWAIGNGSAPGIRIDAGATGHSVTMNGGSTSGRGINIVTTNGNGINIDANGAANGVSISAGSVGSGLYLQGGSTSGSCVSMFNTSGSQILIPANSSNNPSVSVVGNTGGSTGNAIRLSASTGSVVRINNNATTTQSAGIHIGGTSALSGSEITYGILIDQHSGFPNLNDARGVSIGTRSYALQLHRNTASGSGNLATISVVNTGESGTGVIISGSGDKPAIRLLQSENGNAIEFITENGNGIDIDSNGLNKVDINASTFSNSMKDEIFSAVYHDLATFDEVQQLISTTSFFGTNALSNEDDFYKYGVIVFKTGIMKGIARRISSYTGATKTIVVDKAFPEQPSVGDEFIIIGLIL